MNNFFKNFLWVSGIISIPIALIVLFFFVKNHTEKEKFILPDNFYGPVIILYGDRNGEEKIYSNDIRIYHVPCNGIAKTKFFIQTGILNVQYFRKNGTEIRYLSPGDIVWRDTANTDYKNDSIYVYKSTTTGDFIVGKPKDLPKLFQQLELKWQSFSIPQEFKPGEQSSHFKHNKLFDNK